MMNQHRRDEESDHSSEGSQPQHEQHCSPSQGGDGTVLIGGEFVRNQFGQCTANAEIEEAEVA